MADDKGALEKAVTLDFSLDDIEDVPGFAVFPTGAYHVNLHKGLEQKKINDKPAFAIEMQLVNTEECHDLDEDEQPPKIGDICTLSFMAQNKFGADSLKKFLLPIAKKFNTRNIGELAAIMKGMQLLIVIKRTYNSEKDVHYAKFKKIAVL